MAMSSRNIQVFIVLVVITIFSAIIALPESVPINFNLAGYNLNTTIGSPNLRFTLLGKTYQSEFKLKQGLDIQGGMQVVLEADMSEIAPEDRLEALAAAREVMLRRVDLFGINEPVVQTSILGDRYRLIVELAGIEDPNQALQLIGTTAELDFRLLNQETLAEFEGATASAATVFEAFEPTGITGQQLKRSTVQFGQGQSATAGQPVVSIEFDQEGSDIFRQVTTDHTGEVLAIFLDGVPLMTPVIQTPIANGQAVISGDFSLDEARNLSIQLNAGALPVPITVIEQRVVGASLGQQSVQESVQAGLIGLGLVMLFMIMFYGVKGFLASLALGVYSVITIAVYKILGVTLTLPGIAGLLLSIGMAVDANILIFERMKEELRDGRPFAQAMEMGFGRAWDSIKDANLATILTALVLINPFDLPFLNTSGLVRGFGITLFIGVLISLFTGVFVTRTLLRLFLKDPS